MRRSDALTFTPRFPSLAFRLFTSWCKTMLARAFPSRVVNSNSRKIHSFAQSHPASYKLSSVKDNQLFVCLLVSHLFEREKQLIITIYTGSTHRLQYSIIHSPCHQRRQSTPPPSRLVPWVPSSWASFFPLTKWRMPNPGLHPRSRSELSPSLFWRSSTRSWERPWKWTGAPWSTRLSWGSCPLWQPGWTSSLPKPWRERLSHSWELSARDHWPPGIRLSRPLPWDTGFSISRKGSALERRTL